MNTIIARRITSVNTTRATTTSSSFSRPVFSQQKNLLSVPLRNLNKDKNSGELNHLRKQNTDDKWTNLKESTKDVAKEAAERTGDMVGSMAGAVASRAKDAAQATAKTVKDAVQSATTPDNSNRSSSSIENLAPDANKLKDNYKPNSADEASENITHADSQNTANSATSSSTTSGGTSEVLSNIKDGIMKTAEFAAEKTKQLKDKAMDMISNTTTEEMTEKGKEVKHRGEELAQQVKDRASEAATNVKNRASETIEKAKNKI